MCQQPTAQPAAPSVVLMCPPPQPKSLLLLHFTIQCTGSGHCSGYSSGTAGYRYNSPRKYRTVYCNCTSAVSQHTWAYNIVRCSCVPIITCFVFARLPYICRCTPRLYYSCALYSYGTVARSFYPGPQGSSNAKRVWNSKAYDEE